MDRKKLDHERYIRNREERLRKQREYYLNNRDRYLNYRKKRVIRERNLLYG